MTTLLLTLLVVRVVYWNVDATKSSLVSKNNTTHCQIMELGRGDGFFSADPVDPQADLSGCHTSRQVAGTTTTPGSCTACTGTTTWAGSNADACVAVTDLSVCTGKVSAGGVARLVTSATADNTCTACTGGAAGTFGPADGSADCKPVTACAGTTDGTVNRAEVAVPSAIADRTCTPCATNFWAAYGDNTACAAKTVCGKQVAVGTAAAADRTTTTPANLIADTVCQACTLPLTFGANAGNCANKKTAANVNAGAVCGTQLATSTHCKTTRAFVVGDSQTEASCAPCVGGHAAANGNCDEYTTCGTQDGGASRLTGNDATNAGTCTAVPTSSSSSPSRHDNRVTIVKNK